MCELFVRIVAMVRRPGPWPGRWPGSSPRPPAAQRAATLQGHDLLLQQLVGHGDLAELGLEAEQLLITAVALALLHRRLCPDQGTIPPPAQTSGGDVELPAHGLQRLAAQQAGDGGQLALRGEAAIRPGRARGGAGVSVL